jgi:hypothetical protein
MISPLANKRVTSCEQTTGARFWHEGKWHWVVEALLFAVLGIACAWPIAAAAAAMAELCQRIAT